MLVYVVTAPDLGWDCIVGTFDNKEAADKLAALGEDYIVLTTRVQSTFLPEEWA